MNVCKRCEHGIIIINVRSLRSGSILKRVSNVGHSSDLVSMPSVY